MSDCNLQVATSQSVCVHVNFFLPLKNSKLTTRWDILKLFGRTLGLARFHCEWNILYTHGISPVEVSTIYSALLCLKISISSICSKTLLARISKKSVLIKESVKELRKLSVISFCNVLKKPQLTAQLTNSYRVLSHLVNPHVLKSTHWMIHFLMVHTKQVGIIVHVIYSSFTYGWISPMNPVYRT